MHIKEFYNQLRAAIADNRFDVLPDYQVQKPKYFNWVKDIFYDRVVKTNPEGTALIWRYNDQEKHYTFKHIFQEANQFLNFLRKQGIEKGHRIYTQLPLVPANWTSTLAAIKGGFVVIPSATTLTAKDIAYRFEKLFPEVAIADKSNAVKIEAAEQLLQKKIPVKMK